MLTILRRARWLPFSAVAASLILSLTCSGCRAPAVVTEEPPAPPPAVAAPVVPVRPPHLADPARAPGAAQLLRELALRYEPHMSPEARQHDFQDKIALLQERTGIRRMPELRHRSLDLMLRHGGEISWETLRRLQWPDRAYVGVTLTVPVWVPSQARPIKTYAGFAKHWRTVADTRPRPSGLVYHASSLHDINNKRTYRAATLSFEINSAHAPFAALLLEYIFREGFYQPEKRVPLLVIRGGEDTYAASSASGPLTMEALSFRDDHAGDFDARLVRLRFDNYAHLYHGRHAAASNHRLGCALDLNDFNLKEAVDGSPNPISKAARQNHRDAMHRLDARNLPQWVYAAAGKIGYRLPQQWLHSGNTTDWPHLDCGNK